MVDADIVVFVPGFCPRHPGVKTSSDDGMFDAPCYKCEGEADEAYQAWLYDPVNSTRPFCRLEPWFPHEPRWSHVKRCNDSVLGEDNIPF